MASTHPATRSQIPEPRSTSRADTAAAQPPYSGNQKVGPRRNNLSAKVCLSKAKLRNPDDCWSLAARNLTPEDRNFPGLPDNPPSTSFALLRTALCRSARNEGSRVLTDRVTFSFVVKNL